MSSFNGREGFALPTVLISSVVMMIVLLSSLTASSSITAGIREQYLSKLADQATEAGLNMAKACLERDPDATWTTLGPNTNCSGTADVNCTTSPNDSRCWVLNSAAYRTTFTVGALVRNGRETVVSASGRVLVRQASGGATVRTVNDDAKLSITSIRNPAADRAVERFWYVGEPAGGGSARMDFGATGTADPVISSRQASPTFTEGMTVVSATDGSLEFSTNGITAHDSSNRVMPGSSGGLGATGSTAQGVVAFPVSGNRYVVIGNSAGQDGTDPANPGSYGIFRRSVIDMGRTGSNGSRGDVEPGSIQAITRADLNAVGGTANQVLAEPNGTENYTGQHMTAAPEANGRGYWVVFSTPGRPYFYAVLFNNQGDITRVVRSNAPNGDPIPVCRPTSGGAWRAGFGTMRFNSAYDKLALASGTSGCNTTDTARKMPSGYNQAFRDAGWVFLRSFNNSTGVIGNVHSHLGGQRWYGGFCAQDSYNQNGYSVDFSPDENYLYSTSIYPGHLFRYRITGSDIESGSVNVDTTTQFIGRTGVFNGTFDPAFPRGGQVRRAPNDKMYVANQGSTAISVLSNPDSSDASSFVAGTCQTSLRAANFSYNSFTLGSVGSTPIRSGLGLPDYVTRYTPRSVIY